MCLPCLCYVYHEYEIKEMGILDYTGADRVVIPEIEPNGIEPNGPAGMNPRLGRRSSKGRSRERWVWQNPTYYMNVFGFFTNSL